MRRSSGGRVPERLRLHSTGVWSMLAIGCVSGRHQSAIATCQSGYRSCATTGGTETPQPTQLQKSWTFLLTGPTCCQGRCPRVAPCRAQRETLSAILT